MSKSKNPGYIGGDHWETCDRCGQAFRSSQMKTQWDGLRVCQKDYDTRHQQDAVRETGSGCGTGPGGAGLDWNWGGGGYKPDLDPTTFIQEPNDAYFTNPPDGTFGDYLGDEVIWTPDDIPNLLIWVDPQKETEFYTDVARTTAITSEGQSVASIDQTAYDLNDYLEQSTAGDRPTFHYNFFNGLNAMRIPELNTWIGGTSYTDKIPNYDYTAFVLISSMVYPDTSGYMTIISNTDGTDSRLLNHQSLGFKKFYVGHAGGLTEINYSLSDYDETDSGKLFCWRWEQDGSLSVDVDLATTLSTTEVIGDDGRVSTFSIGSENYPTHVGSADFYVLEILIYDAVLSDTDYTRVQDYLNEKYSLGFTR
jgi:hypothetical protein